MANNVLNPDGTIKLVTADTITTMFWPNNTLYADTDINAWLNTEFLNTLYNYQNLLNTDAVWDATIMTSYEEKPTKTTLVTAPVGLLTAYEYYISYKDFVGNNTNLSILSNGTYQWSMTMTSTSSAYCTTAMSFGLNIESLEPSYDDVVGVLLNASGGIRPAIYLQSSFLYQSGDGSKSNPYVLKDSEKEITYNETLLNTRFSGEYVQLDSKLFRIIKTTAENSKLILNDTIDVGDPLVVDSYDPLNELNNTWYNTLSTTTQDMIINGTYNFSDGSSWSGKVGMPLMNEYMIMTHSFDSNAGTILFINSDFSSILYYEKWEKFGVKKKLCYQKC